jgi:hypothetical protein
MDQKNREPLLLADHLGLLGNARIRDATNLLGGSPSSFTSSGAAGCGVMFQVCVIVFRFVRGPHTDSSSDLRSMNFGGCDVG